MPLVRIQTNVDLAKEEAESLASETAAIVAPAIGKPVGITMAIVEASVPMSFGESSDPTALFEIEGIELDAEPAGALCDGLSDLAEERLGVDSSRVFVKLTRVPRGYWAGNRKVY